MTDDRKYIYVKGEKIYGKESITRHLFSPHKN